MIECSSPRKFHVIKATYLRIALDLIESYANDAEINGLKLDRDAEERAVEMFASNLLKAGESFLGSGEETPYIPSWNRVTSVYPQVFGDLMDAVLADKAAISRMADKNLAAV